jgi:hypothetical protein
LDDAQALEQIRRRLVTVADRHRHAEYGYAGVGAARPVQEGQLAELGSRDLDLMEDADRIEGIVRDVTAAIERNEASELEHLRAAVDDYASTLERRRQSL